MNKITPEETRDKLIARREAHEEFDRLSDRYWKLRETTTAESILFAWFQFGDAMWEGLSDGRRSYSS